MTAVKQMLLDLQFARRLQTSGPSAMIPPRKCATKSNIRDRREKRYAI